MPADDVIQEEQTEHGKVLDWRMSQLCNEGVGYTPEAGAKIARQLHVDLHRAVDLRLAGCSEELALRILL